MIIEATNDAITEIKKILAKQDRDDLVIRINISGFGWGGPSMGLVLDEQKENDYVEEIDDVTFVAGEDLKSYKGFDVEYVSEFLRKGFVITPKGVHQSSC